MYLYKNGEPDHLDATKNHGFNPENHKPNWNWRGTKADIYEAGHRVPFMIRWPNKIKPKQVDETVCLTDVAATLVELLSLNADPSQMEDSYSLVPLLNGKTEFTRKPVIHQSGSGGLAIRKGDYKLILGSGSAGREQPRGKVFGKPYQLYNLAVDPAETTNLIDDKKDLAKELEKEFFEMAGDDIIEKDFKGLKK
jgi:arylsulfatase A